jgi:hypothetical protein
MTHWRPPGHLVLGVAEALQERVVDRHEAAFAQGGDAHRKGRSLEDPAELLLRAIARGAGRGKRLRHPGHFALDVRDQLGIVRPLPQRSEQCANARRSVLGARHPRFR